MKNASLCLWRFFFLGGLCSHILCPVPYTPTMAEVGPIPIRLYSQQAFVGRPTCSGKGTSTALATTWSEEDTDDWVCSVVSRFYKPEFCSFPLHTLSSRVSFGSTKERFSLQPWKYCCPKGSSWLCLQRSSLAASIPTCSQFLWLMGISSLF